MKTNQTLTGKVFYIMHEMLNTKGYTEILIQFSNECFLIGRINDVTYLQAKKGYLNKLINFNIQQKVSEVSTAQISIEQ
jgi:hypothetical protein